MKAKSRGVSGLVHKSTTVNDKYASSDDKLEVEKFIFNYTFIIIYSPSLYCKMYQFAVSHIVNIIPNRNVPLTHGVESKI